MKMVLSDDEIEFLTRFNALSPEVKARVRRLIRSWIKRNEEKKNTNNVIPFVKKDSRNEAKS